MDLLCGVPLCWLAVADSRDPTCSAMVFHLDAHGVFIQKLGRALAELAGLVQLVYIELIDGLVILLVDDVVPNGGWKAKEAFQAVAAATGLPLLRPLSFFLRLGRDRRVMLDWRDFPPFNVVSGEVALGKDDGALPGIIEAHLHDRDALGRRWLVSSGGPVR